MVQPDSFLQQFIDRSQTRIATAWQSTRLRRLRRSVQVFVQVFVQGCVQPDQDWLMGLALLGVLLLWNWQLFTSLAIGLGVLVMLFLAQQRQLRLPRWYQIGWRVWQTIWSPAHRSLTVAILGGLAAMGSTYLTLAIWQVSDHPALAMATILQGVGILAVLALLIWPVIQSSQFAGAVETRSNPALSTTNSAINSAINSATNSAINSATNAVTDALANLSAVDPLQRLIAVHWLTEQVRSTESEFSAAHLVECFRLMLDRETEPAVCGALLASLQTLGQRSDQALHQTSDNNQTGDQTSHPMRSLAAASQPVWAIESSIEPQAEKQPEISAPSP